ncbi:TPR-like protein [Dioscorea alata]|uniref:TPR-like protein n=1 Tax=Dioscorea alata TaxID=55571 RepID=A0ACB7V2R1_DIOAL|nr:TPR-like protein [Dioscorea alata]
MQNNLFTTIRSLKLVDGCKSAAIFTIPPSSSSSSAASSSSTSAASSSSETSGKPHLLPLLRSKSIQPPPLSHHNQPPLKPPLVLPYGLPSSDLIDPPVDPFLRTTDPIPSLSSLYRRFSRSPSLPSSELCDLYLEHYSLLRSLADPKLLRRSLRNARLYASDPHHKLVFSAWLRFERRDDELHHPPPLLPCLPSAPPLECPRSALSSLPDSPSSLCPCHRDPPLDSHRPSVELDIHDDDDDDGDGDVEVVEEDGDEADVYICIGDDEVGCSRHRIAALSRPLWALLYGEFAESRRTHINFGQNHISPNSMKAVETFSRRNKLEDDVPIDVVLEILSFANKFCCDGLKSACDERLASLVLTIDDALQLIDFGLEETAYLLVAACLQVFLRGLPKSLQDPEIMRLLCSPEGKERLLQAGHASFALYYFLSQVAMEEEMRSNTTVMLFERLNECAAPGWQKQLALHQLGCVMLERQEYKDAQKLFEEAVAEGHAYSQIGVARAKYKRGHKYAAYKQINGLFSEHNPTGWMYQERSLYGIGKEKMADLKIATELDPTLSYPYKYRAITLMEDNKISAAIAEINKIIRFKVSTDCLELRAWFFLAIEDYEGALQDIRALMTLDPNYMMFHGKLHGEQMIEILKQRVHQLDMADCWMQLYDRWSAVDDIGSLAVVHQMLSKEPANSSLRFRQSLLLLRLNCQKAAMHSLRMARNNSSQEHERLVYEGWILYDTGHREEALAKAEESIAIQRSFEAFFLKAYALADSSLDQSLSSYVIQLLEQANSCASDNLRKGQVSKTTATCIEFIHFAFASHFVVCFL